MDFNEGLMERSSSVLGGHFRGNDREVMIQARSRLRHAGSAIAEVDSGWIAAVVASTLIVFLIAGTPWFGTGLRAIVGYAFQSLCHRLPSRSFEVGGIPFAVCHRCFGIYVGVALGLIVCPALHRVNGGTLRMPTRLILGAALIPLGLDWGLDAVGLWHNTVLTRVLTGFMAGSVGGLCLGAALLRGASSGAKSTLLNATPP